MGKRMLKMMARKGLLQGKGSGSTWIYMETKHESELGVSRQQSVLPCKERPRP